MTKATLTSEEALFRIASAQIANINVVMGGGDADDLTLDRIQMTDAVAIEFRHIAQNSSWWDASDYQLRPYDPGYKPDSRDVVYAQIADIPGLQEFVALVASPANLPQFKGDDSSIERLRFYAIVGGTKTDLHEDIEAMPRGYETVIGDRGGALSGGQQQRIALARAVLGNPRLLVLDEATNQLDGQTESQIEAHLASLTCTRVIISHRQSVVRNARRIVVLQGGNIIEEGTHDDRVATRGEYTRLFRMHDETIG